MVIYGSVAWGMRYSRKVQKKYGRFYRRNVEEKFLSRRLFPKHYRKSGSRVTRMRIGSCGRTFHMQSLMSFQCSVAVAAECEKNRDVRLLI